ncbi:uncharacterized protein LOC132656390 [Meriones unguiculatus]|uniref:uncharacterized protein LOC132656390 n=1 Tax=Meriones unguiculatus TaxID=10047 RepID=UPI00293E0420|nr:uncharacterized protein LOC132656390 [Meriones unguiculatus]
MRRAIQTLSVHIQVRISASTGTSAPFLWLCRRYSGLRRCPVGTLVSISVNRSGRSSNFLLLKVVTAPLSVTTTPSFQAKGTHSPGPSSSPPPQLFPASGGREGLGSCTALARPEALPRVQPHRSQPGLYLLSGLEKLCAMRGALVLRKREQKTAWISAWKGKCTPHPSSRKFLLATDRLLQKTTTNQNAVVKPIPSRYIYKTMPETKAQDHCGREEGL